MTFRYRKLDANGDRVFGHAASDFYIDQPEAVAQAAQTRLGLFLREWFLDTTDGTDWFGRVLGTGTQATYDVELRQRILGTPYLTALPTYASTRNTDPRELDVTALITTAFGAVPLAVAQYVAPPSVPVPLQPTQLLALDGTVLLGPRDGALLFDPLLPLS